jgi:hypothetical protein
MTQAPAKRFPAPAIGSLPDDIRSRILAVQEKSGFVPNVFLTLAYRPDEFRAFFAYHDALMEKPVGWVERSDTHRVTQMAAGRAARQWVSQGLNPSYGLQQRSVSSTLSLIERITVMKMYKAMIWDNDPQKPGKRVTVLAQHLDDAKKQLEEEYGEGRVFNLHNEEDAAQPR